MDVYIVMRILATVKLVATDFETYGTIDLRFVFERCKIARR